MLQSVSSKLFLEFPELSHGDPSSHQKVTQAEKEFVPTTSQVPERPQKGRKEFHKTKQATDQYLLFIQWLVIGFCLEIC